MLARYYVIPTIGRLYLFKSGSLSHNQLAIYSAYSSLACATTILMVRACARLVLWEYRQRLICHKLPYAFLHQSLGKHTHPFAPLINYLNPILTFDKNPVPSSCINTPITIQMTQFKYFYFLLKPFSFSPTSRKFQSYSYLIHTFTNTSMVPKTRLLCHLFYDTHIKTI